MTHELWKPEFIKWLPTVPTEDKFGWHRPSISSVTATTEDRSLLQACSKSWLVNVLKKFRGKQFGKFGMPTSLNQVPTGWKMEKMNVKAFIHLQMSWQDWLKDVPNYTAYIGFWSKDLEPLGTKNYLRTKVCFWQKYLLLELFLNKTLRIRTGNRLLRLKLKRMISILTGDASFKSISFLPRNRNWNLKSMILSKISPQNLWVALKLLLVKS